jgi:DNA-binding HxlR family transcriptional regulator
MARQSPRPRVSASAHPTSGHGDGVTRRRGASESGPLPELDRVIHERMRLAIVSALAANESLSFHDLKNLLGTTDGNLSVHARRLEEAGYVAFTKSFHRRMPRTLYRLTPEGRSAFQRYLGHLEALVHGSRKP